MTVKFEGLTMNQLAERNAELHVQIAELQRKVDALAVECHSAKTLLGRIHGESYDSDHEFGKSVYEKDTNFELQDFIENQSEAGTSTPSSDAELAEIRERSRAEGIYFTANRLLAAWDAGFIDSPDKEVIDVARMILSAAEMLPDAVEGDFSREFADEMMGELTKKLRKGADQ